MHMLLLRLQLFKLGFSAVSHFTDFLADLTEYEQFSPRTVPRLYVDVLNKRERHNIQYRTALKSFMTHL